MKVKSLSQSAYLPALSTIAASIVVYSMSALPGVIQEAKAAPLEEVVVTARKRDESLQDVPFSIQALTADLIEKRGARSLEDIAANVAGFTIQNTGPGQSMVAIRGISAGQIIRDQPGVKEQVGIYLDESAISLSLFTPDLDFADMQRVEVLRGPQGTLYGSGSTSGTVRYITNKAEIGSDEGNIQIGLNSVTDGGTGGDLRLVKNFPLSDKAAARLVAYTTQYGGFIDSVTPDGNVREDVNDGSRSGFRLGFTFQPNDTLTIRPRVIYQDMDIDGANRQDSYNLNLNQFTTTRPARVIGGREQVTFADEPFTDEFLFADLVIEKDFGATTLTSVTSYTDRDIAFIRDSSALNGSVYADLGSPGLIDTYAPLLDATEVEMLTQELRLASNDNEKVNWVAGLYYSDIQRDYGQTLEVSNGAAVTRGLGITDILGTFPAIPNENVLFYSEIPYDLEQSAVFGEVDFQVNDKLTLTVGGRYYDYEEDRVLTFDALYADQALGVPGNAEADGFSPRVVLAYDVDDDTQVNFQAAEGFRLGGVNDPLNLTLCQGSDVQTFGGFTEFDDEEVTNYELGIKTSIMDGAGTFNAAIFHADIENLQTTLVAGSCSSRIIFNVPEAHATGIEMELSANLSDKFDIALTGSYIESEIDSTIVGNDGSVLGGIRDGNRLPTVPELQFAVSTNYAFDFNDWEGNWTVVFQHVGDRFTQLADQENGAVITTGITGNVGNPTISSLSLSGELPSYELVNTRVSIVRDNVEWGFYVNNVFDEEALLSLDNERAFRARHGHRVNQPRTIGVDFKYNFGE